MQSMHGEEIRFSSRRSERSFSHGLLSILRIRLPDADGTILGTGGVRLAIGSIPEASDGTVMALVALQLFPRRKVKHSHPQIAATRDELGPVGMERRPALLTKVDGHLVRVEELPGPVGEIEEGHGGAVSDGEHRLAVGRSGKFHVSHFGVDRQRLREG